MRYGIFSDIHGNLEAFEAVIEAFKSEHIDQYLCVGDVIGYGANPSECIRLVNDLKAIWIAGNHDWGCVGKVDLAYFNPVAKEAILWTQDKLSLDQKEMIRHLNLVFANDDLTMVHGTLQKAQEFLYLTKPSLALEMFPLMERQICFIGHTHVPQIIVQEARGIEIRLEKQIKLDPYKKYIVNTGSVGQPRDYNPDACFCIYDSKSKLLENKRIPYNIVEAQKKILQVKLPTYLALRLALGQ